MIDSIRQRWLGPAVCGWLGLASVSVGCDPAAEPPPAATEACIPGGTPQGLPSTAREYVAMCEPSLGVPPAFDCAAGVTVPITVDGVEVNEPLAPFACDAPSLQEGECVPGSTIQRHAGTTRDGQPRPEVTWVQFCRNEAGVDDEGSVTWAFTGAQMLGYNMETGATCYFELNHGGQDQWVGRDDEFRAVGVLPSHDDPAFDDAFIPPTNSQCVQCHQNDPFVHNPWIDGARMPDDPEEPVLPTITDPKAPHYVVGGSYWDMRTLHIEGNACLSCHRVGMETELLFRENGWDVNTHMPPSAPGSMANDWQALRDCWERGPENTPGCEWRVAPAGGCDERVAGPGYPFAAEHFNTARDSFYPW